MTELSLERYNITKPKVLRNASPAVLYEGALTHETGSAITNTGALVVRSGEKNRTQPRGQANRGTPGQRRRHLVG